MVRNIAQWVTEAWCHGHPINTEETETVIVEVVIPAAVIAAVIAEAEILCAAAAVVAEVAV